ncbi:uncharacterized protein FA14DRAFT_161231 [Meira miltonrushii]|uniref:Telomere replication protein EST3 n=1 Tax=Meira miltonrushii TaxID=1280837 RepID=A0A316V792_9BASI|nr:uncharacterized protein FA14DRAFT_161231 [Meira miltonrushii]PWN33312.1 hypothetical protein FA14DRAFT_161231 [Meira miltonrushii]
MAESLTPWMARSVCHGLLDITKEQKKQYSLGDDDEIAEENDDVTSFQRGSKVQIVRFLGFGAANVIHRQQDDTALWAIVADRTHWTCVKFSKECVDSFDRMHTRKLISMRGSVIALRWYRPGASIQADKLYSIEANSRGGGPFAAAVQSNESISAGIVPRLVLHVESIQLWGSINESIFWDTDDLQKFLLEDESHGGGVGNGTTSSLMMDREHKSAFKKWIGSIRRRYARAYAKKHQKTNATIQSASTLSSKQFTTGSEFSGPKPYQQPVEKKRTGRQAEAESVDAREKKKAKVEKADWGDSSLSWSDDHFGLQAAADTLLERKDGHSVIPNETETDFSDPFALATSAKSDEPSSLEVAAPIQSAEREVPQADPKAYAKEESKSSSNQDESGNRSSATEKDDSTSPEKERDPARSGDVNWTDLLNLADE